MIELSKRREELRYASFWPLIVIAVIILCLSAIFNHPAVFGIKAFDFSESGQIGDTIGGITAPFFNLIAAVLIFLSFREQAKTNEYFLRSARIEKGYDIIFHLIENIDSSIRAFEYRLTTNHSGGQKTATVYSGIAGLQCYTNDLHMNEAKGAKQRARQLNEQSPEAPYTLNCYSDVYQIIGLIEFTASKIINADFRIDDSEHDEVQASLFERLEITYSTSLKHSIETFIQAFDKAAYDHDSFKEIKELYRKYDKTKASILASRR